MERSLENKTRRKALKSLEQWVYNQNTTHPNLTTPDDANISIRVIPTLKPRFFQPFPDGSLGEMHPEYKGNDFPENPQDPNEDNEYSLYLRGEYQFEPLDEFSHRDPKLYSWSAVDIFHYKEPSTPHLKCYLRSAITGDERLLRGELLSLLRIMRGRLRSKGFENHIVAPVLILSLMRPQHARIIEGYFDGKELVVSHSPLYDFTREQNSPILLFVRYLLSEPVGDTRGGALFGGD